ncbi:MAG: aldo/keto reductase, partial [Acidithiobacillaceae bacterium]|nr:aldo/keto reductase [Acidithiobacillaceae bacterium]
MADSFSRRQFLTTLGLAGLALKSPVLFANTSKTPSSSLIMRRIPGTDESVPAIGMGTWITFNVGGDAKLIEQRTEVLKTFFELGGTVIDSSPMYGTSPDVVGKALAALEARD